MQNCVSRAAYLLTRIIVCTLLLLAVPAGALAEPSDPTTAEIEALRTQADEAQDTLSGLAIQLELRAEEYAEIEAALDVTDVEIRATRKELAQAEADLLDAQDILSLRAARIYRSGGTNVLELLLETASFRDLVSRIEFLSRVGRSDAVAVVAVKETRRRVELAETSLQTRRAEQVTLRDAAAVKRLQVEEALQRQQAYINGLTAEIATLVEEERERQRVAAEEAAQRAAELAKAISSEPLANLGGLGTGHPEAVTIALGYVGVPYVWGGATPSGFDCSGLTQYVYAQLGIQIPRNSRSQYQAGTHVPSDRVDLLLPGDLVFFGYDGDPGQVHHVGVYVGSGDYLHAPQTGETVKVQSLTQRIAQSADYVGASRF